MYKFNEEKNNIIPIVHTIARANREKIKNQKGCVLWLTGLSGSGKSTIANELEYKLNRLRYHTYLLDGDNIRSRLNKDLGFSDSDRTENIRRVSEVAKLFLDAGVITITAFISPFAKDREEAKKIIGDDFVEIFVDAPFEVCKQRDPKGLYKKATSGKIKNFIGIDLEYEIPKNAHIHLKTDKEDINECVNKIVLYLKEKNYIKDGNNAKSL